MSPLSRGTDLWSATIAAAVPNFDATILTRHLRVVELSAGGVLLRAGTVASGIWLLVDGAVRMSYYRRGREHIGDFFLAGQTCTDFSSLVTRSPSRLWLTATEPTVACELPWSAVEDATQRDLVGTERLRRVVAEGLTVEFAGRVWSSLMDTPAERYQTLLRERPQWFARFPQYMIASYLGLTPEGLSKLRRRLATGN
jgi:CRP-like cAMP-binding protein